MSAVEGHGVLVFLIVVAGLGLHHSAIRRALGVCHTPWSPGR